MRLYLETAPLSQPFIRCDLDTALLPPRYGEAGTFDFPAWQPRRLVMVSKDFCEFLSSLPQSDRDHWASLTPPKRKAAEDRFAIFEAWRKGALSAEVAISRFGKSSSRFYRLAAQWREKPSLEALGVGVRAPRTRQKLDPAIVNALQSKVASVVRLNADASIRRQVELLLEAAGFGNTKPIGAVALRKIVEAERRRVDAVGRIGQQIGFDCTAINVPQPGGRPYILYVVIDIGTGLALGFSVGKTLDIASGYGAAAADALDWIAQQTRSLPWAPTLVQTIIVSGDDDAQSASLIDWMKSEGLGGNPLRATGRRRFGSQFRKAFDDRIGRVQITPARTIEGEALPDNGNMTPWPETDVDTELRRTFLAHNEKAFNRLTDMNGTEPASGLIELLARLSARH